MSVKVMQLSGKALTVFRELELIARFMGNKKIGELVK